MKYIRKDPPPRSLVEYRNRPGATYKKFTRGKIRYNETKKALCNEQGYICCYCGRRIKTDSRTQIEHFYAKGTAEYEEMQLDYETNLLACCDGGKAERHQGLIDKTKLFCEAVKGNKILPVNPLTIECENKFLFDSDGIVIGVGKDAEVTIKMLNLNSPYLVNMRKHAINYYNTYCPTFTREEWEQEMIRLDQKRDGEFEEFCFVLKSFIDTFMIHKPDSI